MKKMTATPVRLKAFTYTTKKLTRIRKATIKSSTALLQKTADIVPYEPPALVAVLIIKR
jgi:hypothetical protein